MTEPAIKHEYRPIERLGHLAERLTHRPYRADDYATAHAWWMKYNRGHLEQKHLSPFGLVVEDTEPIAMGWLYMSNADITQLGWVVTNPDVGPKRKMAALLRLFIVAEEFVRSYGFTSIQMMSDSPVLSKVSQWLGWQKLRPHDFMLKSLSEDDDDV